MAEALEGRNALIQVQVDNHYYTRKVGDLNRLTENPRHVKVKSRESYIGWMRERIKEAEITVGTRYNHFATLRVLQQFQPKLTFDGLTGLQRVCQASLRRIYVAKAMPLTLLPSIIRYCVAI